jgi:hypothetical protein
MSELRVGFAEGGLLPRRGIHKGYVVDLGLVALHDMKLARPTRSVPGISGRSACRTPTLSDSPWYSKFSSTAFSSLDHTELSSRTRYVDQMHNSGACAVSLTLPLDRLAFYRCARVQSTLKDDRLHHRASTSTYINPIHAEEGPPSPSRIYDPSTFLVIRLSAYRGDLHSDVLVSCSTTPPFTGHHRLLAPSPRTQTTLSTIYIIEHGVLLVPPEELIGR